MEGEILQDQNYESVLMAYLDSDPSVDSSTLLHNQSMFRYQTYDKVLHRVMKEHPKVVIDPAVFEKQDYVEALKLYCERNPHFQPVNPYSEFLHWWIFDRAGNTPVEGLVNADEAGRVGGTRVGNTTTLSYYELNLFKLRDHDDLLVDVLKQSSQEEGDRITNDLLGHFRYRHYPKALEYCFKHHRGSIPIAKLYVFITCRLYPEFFLNIDHDELDKDIIKRSYSDELSPDDVNGTNITLAQKLKVVIYCLKNGMYQNKRDALNHDFVKKLDPPNIDHYSYYKGGLDDHWYMNRNVEITNRLVDIILDLVE